MVEYKTKMSQNLPLLNLYKPFLNYRLNNLQLDGGFTIDGTEPLAGAASTTFNCSATGSLLVADQVVPVKVTRIGDLVTFEISQFTVSLANQNASGDLDVSFSVIPNSYFTSGVVSNPIIFQNPAGSTVVTRGRINSALKTLEIYGSAATRLITKGAQPVGLVGKVVLSWVL